MKIANNVRKYVPQTKKKEAWETLWENISVMLRMLGLSNMQYAYARHIQNSEEMTGKRREAIMAHVIESLKTHYEKRINELLKIEEEYKALKNQ